MHKTSTSIKYKSNTMVKTRALDPSLVFRVEITRTH